jgi:hypothetical protein
VCAPWHLHCHTVRLLLVPYTSRADMLQGGFYEKISCFATAYKEAFIDFERLEEGRNSRIPASSKSSWMLLESLHTYPCMKQLVFQCSLPISPLNVLSCAVLSCQCAESGVMVLLYYRVTCPVYNPFSANFNIAIRLCSNDKFFTLSHKISHGV